MDLIPGLLTADSNKSNNRIAKLSMKIRVSYWYEHHSTAEPGQRTPAAEYLGANPNPIALTDSTIMGPGLVWGALKLAGIVSDERNERAVAEPVLHDKN